MNDQDQITEDERHEAAAEEPINGASGVRALPHFPSGADGTEPAPKKRSEVEKLNEILFERLGEIAKKCCAMRVECDPEHVDYDAAETNIKLFGAFSELRQMCDFYKPREKPIDPTAPEMKDKAAAYRRAHYSFGDGLFPIQRLNGVECVIERCVINGREFKLTIQDSSMGDQHFSKAKLRDNGEVVCYFFTKRGKAISEKMAHGALKAYVHNLSGGGRDYHSRGGFLKQQIARAKKQ